jgi:hypothetical protein
VKQIKQEEIVLLCVNSRENNTQGILSIVSIKGFPGVFTVKLAFITLKLSLKAKKEELILRMRAICLL